MHRIDMRMSGTKVIVFPISLLTNVCMLFNVKNHVSDTHLKCYNDTTFINLLADFSGKHTQSQYQSKLYGVIVRTTVR